MSNRYRTWLAAALVAGLGGCGGGGAGDGSETSAVYGRISGFGSVIVDGVHYDTRGATIVVDDRPGSEDDLAVGMLVWVHGDDDGRHGRATHIRIRDELEGIVQANDVGADGTGSLLVMGFRVLADEETVFDSDVAGITTLDQVPVDAIVEVSGHPDGAGEILATRIELKHEAFIAGVHELEVKGRIGELDDMALTFVLADTLVVYYGDAELDDIPGGSLRNGLFVEVESTLGFDDQGRLIASEVEHENGREHDFRGADKVKIEGKISAVTRDPDTNAVRSIVVDDMEILVNDDTRFKHGGEANLAPGAMVKVKAVKVGEDLVAREIKFKKAKGDIRIEADVEAIELAPDGLSGTITLLGQPVIVNALTMMRDKRDDDDRHNERFFDIGDLVRGDRVDVRAFVDDAGALVAVSLRREKADDDVKLKGPVAIDDMGGVTVVGVPVDLATNFPGFTPAAGMVLELEGTWDGSVLLVDEIEVEDRGEVSAVTRDNGELVDFTLNGAVYRVDDDTEFERGSADEVIVGVVLEVEAEVAGDGALIAEEVKFEKRDDDEDDDDDDDHDDDDNRGHGGDDHGHGGDDD